MARATWRGVTVDDRTRDMLEEVARLTPGVPRLRPTQGSYTTAVGASAGTHAGGGAVDLAVTRPTLTAAQQNETVRVMRLVGFAAWRRLSSEGPWPTHIHAIAVGCPDLSAAAARQVEALRGGRNGLANNGLDRHRGMGLPVITWEQYLGTGSGDGGDDDMLGLKQGDKGARVRYLQVMLGYAGHEPVGGADGDYGPKTSEAVVKVRKSVGSTAVDQDKGREIDHWAAGQIHRAVARNN